MEIDYYRISDLPALVRSFCFSNDGWIVGSGAAYLLGFNEAPNDWDILIPFWQWGEACRSIPRGMLTNSHGGVKIPIGNTSIDVWAGDIGWFLSQVPTMPAYAVHPKTLVFLTSSNTIRRIKEKKP
jgi:hypothetical protein